MSKGLRPQHTFESALEIYKHGWNMPAPNRVATTTMNSLLIGKLISEDLTSQAHNIIENHDK